MRQVSKSGNDFLWQAFLSGDEFSFTLIYEQNINALFSYAYKLTQSREVVHDSIQEVFVDLYLKRDKQHRPIKNLKSYMLVALRNFIVKRLIKERRNKICTLDDASDLSFYAEYSFQDKLIELEVSQEIRHKLQAEILKLPAQQKEIIYLKFEAELEYAEIAEVLQITVESARKLMYRAIKTLRKSALLEVTQVYFFFSGKINEKRCPCFRKVDPLLTKTIA